MTDSLSDHVVHNITIDSVGLQRLGFGIILLLSHTPTWAERVRFYGGSAEVLEDFDEGTPEYRAAVGIFAQTPKPQQIAIGRCDDANVTQVYTLSLLSAPVVGRTYGLKLKGVPFEDTTCQYVALADFTFVDGDITTGTDLIAKTAHGMSTGDGPFRVSNSGGALPTGLAVDTNYWIIATTADGFKLASSKANALAATAVDITAAAGGGTHTLRRCQNDVVIAQLVTQINAIADKDMTAAQVTGAGETDSMTITGDAADGWFSVEVLEASISLIRTAQTHGAGSIADSLAAILLDEPGFYSLYSFRNSPTYALAIAEWAEANDRTYLLETQENQAIDTSISTGTDTLNQLLVLEYANTMYMYHPNPANMMSARLAGRFLSTDPGTSTPKFKNLVGAEPVKLSTTHKNNLRARRANTYERISGRGMFWEGTVASTTYKFFDVRRNLHFADDQIKKSILEMMMGAEIVPHTPDGYTMVEGAVRGPVQGILIRQGVLSDNPEPEVTIPATEDIEDTDKSDRILRNVKWNGVLQGAVHKIFVDGSVTF